MKTKMTHAEWLAEAERRFGADQEGWRFVCPVCKHVTSVADWREAGATEGAIAFSCVGRWLPRARKAFEGQGPGPCNYAGGGLFPLNPVDVDGLTVFAFAEPNALAKADGQ